MESMMKNVFVLLMCVVISGAMLSLGGCYRKETRRLEYGGSYTFEKDDSSGTGYKPVNTGNATSDWSEWR